MSEVAQGQKKGNSVGSFFRFLGVLCLLFWIEIIFYEIQTTEAAMGLNLGHSFMSNLALLGQLVQLVTGGMNSPDIAPIIVGWITELFVLIFTFAYEIGTLFTKKHNSKLTGIFSTVCVLALGWDGWTNWTSGFGGPSIQGRVIFTVVLAAGAVFLPIGALACFRLAVNEG
jgi:hypothetical protein